MSINSEDLRKLPLVSSDKNNTVSIGSGTIVEKEGKVLMVRSVDEKSLWKFPGGHVMTNESIGEAAVRETLEETGFEVEIVDKPIVYEYDLNSNLRLILFFHPAKIIGDGVPEVSDEIVEVKWFGLDEIPENCFENVKHVIKHFRESTNLS